MYLKPYSSRAFLYPCKSMLLPLMLLLFFLASIDANAAVCVFRFPDRDVYKLFPEATSYKTVIEVVDADRVLAVEKLLGGPLDSSDLGRHSIYFVYKEDKPIGIIHPHSEYGIYGTIEMLWAIDINGSIIDFYTQRSREKQTAIFTSRAFRDRFKGMNLESSSSINPANKTFSNRFYDDIPDAKEAVWPIVFAAKKTLAIVRVLVGEAIKTPVK